MIIPLPDNIAELLNIEKRKYLIRCNELHFLFSNNKCDIFDTSILYNFYTVDYIRLDYGSLYSKRKEINYGNNTFTLYEGKIKIVSKLPMFPKIKNVLDTKNISHLYLECFDTSPIMQNIDESNIYSLFV